MHAKELRHQEPTGPYLTCNTRCTLASATPVEEPAGRTPGPNTAFRSSEPFGSSALLWQPPCPWTRTLVLFPDSPPQATPRTSGGKRLASALLKALLANPV